VDQWELQSNEGAATGSEEIRAEAPSRSDSSDERVETRYGVTLTLADISKLEDVSRYAPPEHGTYSLPPEKSHAKSYWSPLAASAHEPCAPCAQIQKRRVRC